MRNITEIVIHCSATRADWFANRSAEEKRDEIRRWHTTAPRNWSDIGYHLLIDRDGTVVDGRPMSRNGAHVKGHNTGTIGVCLIGGHGSSENDAFEDNFTPEQDAALRGLLKSLQRQYPGARKVSGHNEYAAKACPGFRVSRWLDREAPERKSPASSTTVIGAVASAGGTVATGVAAIGKLDPNVQLMVVFFAGVALLGAGWVIRERLRKWAAGDR